jgi:hypothetical protein
MYWDCEKDRGVECRMVIGNVRRQKSEVRREMGRWVTKDV